MISQFLLDIVFDIAYGALNALPDVAWSVETSSFQFFLDAVRVAAYMFPSGILKTVFTFIFLSTVWRITIAVIKTIWEVLPFV